MRALVFCCMGLLFAPPAFSQVEQDPTTQALNKGIYAYDFGDYQKSIAVLTPLVEPEVRIATAEAQVRAYCILGLSHYFLKRAERATDYFQRAIRLRPDHTLDTVVTPPDAVSLFEKIKQQLTPEIAQKKRELEQRKRAEAERRRQEKIEVHPLQVNSRLVAALPFGAGQFQNQSPVLGAVFLGSQVAAISVSVSAFFAVESLRGADGRFRKADVEQARSYQRLQLVSGGLALALIAGGIIEAMISYQPTLKAGKPVPLLKSCKGKPTGPRVFTSLSERISNQRRPDYGDTRVDSVFLC